MKSIRITTIVLAGLAVSLLAFYACDSKYTLIEAFLSNGAETKLFTYTNSNNYNLGQSVAISGDVALAGGYVYRWDGVTTWTKEANLPRSGSVALSGIRAVVGGRGSIYVYRFNGSQWQEEAELSPSDGATNYEFGHAVSMSGRVIAVGAYDDYFSSSPQSGLVYMYRLNGSNWVKEAKLTASSGKGNDGFGSSVCVNGNVAIVGAWGTEMGQGATGMAYVYRFTGSSWREEAKLTASDASAGDGFGRAVAVSGDVAIVGAPYDDESWSQTGLNNRPVRTFAINSAGHIFAGYIGVYRSTDNGKNWNAVNRGLTDVNVQALAINRDGHVFAGTMGGVFRSTDNGETWNPIKSGVSNAYVNAFAINSSGHIFAGTSLGSGVFRSLDNGETWSPINTGLTNTSVLVLTINNQGHIFAGTAGNGIFRSTNNGDNWIPINTGLTNTRVFAFAINRDGHIFAGTLGGGVFRSTNNGDNWTQINSGLADLNVQALAINNDGQIFVGTYYGGVYRSTNNGDSWTQINSGLTDLNVQALAVNNDGHILVGTYGDGVFRSPNNGAFSENSGSAYIFRYNGSSWRQESKLSFTGATKGYFGSAVAVDQNLAIIGAPFDDDMHFFESNPEPGTAYVYRWDGTVWREQKKLAASDGAADNRFGAAVSISGRFAIVGAPNAAIEATKVYPYNSGAAYVYVVD